MLTTKSMLHQWWFVLVAEHPGKLCCSICSEIRNLTRTLFLFLQLESTSSELRWHCMSEVKSFLILLVTLVTSWEEEEGDTWHKRVGRRPSSSLGGLHQDRHQRHLRGGLHQHWAGGSGRGQAVSMSPDIATEECRHQPGDIMTITSLYIHTMCWHVTGV